MSSPKLSVLVPVYNVEDYLQVCLDSLKSQTFGDFEVICVDDGSKDSSASMLDEYAAQDARFKVFHRENQGVSAARNFAIEQAVGEYLLFVDSDDYIEPNTFEKLVNIAERDNSDIVVFGGESFPHVPWIENCFNTPNALVTGDGAEALFNEVGSYPLMCNKMYRRSIVIDNNVRFCEDLKLGEDNAFQFTVFPYAQIVSFTNAIFYHYRCDREDSAISEQYQDRSAKVQKHLKVIEYVFDNWKSRGILDARKSDLLRWSAFFLMDDLGSMDYASRIPLGLQFRELCSSYGLQDALGQLDGHAQQVCHFLWGDLFTGKTPEVSVIYSYDPRVADESPAGLVELQNGYISLVNQLMQDIEIILVPSGHCELPIGFKDDPRCSVASSFTDALSQARSDYVLITSPNYHYDWIFLDALRRTAAQTGADVVSCFEYGGNPSQFAGIERVLKTRDCGTYPGYDCPPSERLYTFASKDIPDYVGSAVTSKLVDKLFRKDYLLSLKHIDSLGLTSWEAICSANKIAFLPYRYFGMLAYDYAPEVVEHWAKSEAECVGAFMSDSEYEAYLDSWAWSSVEAFVESYDRIKGREAKLAFAKAAKQSLEDSGCLDKILSSSHLDPGAFKRFEAIFGKDCNSDSYDDLAWLTYDARGRIGGYEASEFWHEVQHYDFHHSISYRLGRVFIDPVQKCKSIMSHTKRKDMDSGK